MKKIFLTTITFLFVTIVINAQQTTLFDSKGEPIAYIDYEEEEVIFMWDGTPVAFLEKNDGDNCIFGFNGKFLGWYKSGIIYNEEGYPVGAKEGAVNMRTQREPRKSRQARVPRKPRTPRVPRMPSWSRNWSEVSLTSFLIRMD